MSNHRVNRATGLVIACPITSTDRAIPLHTHLAGGPGVTGLATVEQVKAVDSSARRWRRVGQVGRDVVDEVLAIFEACFE